MRTKADQQEMEIQAIRRMERILDELPIHRRFALVDFVRSRLEEELRLRESADPTTIVSVAGVPVGVVNGA